MPRKLHAIGGLGLSACLAWLAGCASTPGLDGSTLSYECQQQAQLAANQPPFPDQIRDGKHGQDFEQGLRDARMTQACQHDVDAQAPHAEIHFGGSAGT
ncbi:hypothetical protein [Pseudoxanthomonas sp. JBR18]|uniref:hypothetical protein n=1 Tax=Pseudoxanthomonas sp. JBR18 TaxID=2969308 RepID=UPI00230556C6|nr:hypothetical protein [Pseudoxanthomonas sp. JBR18]WCE03256.1 hypothetical protein PJ250_14215 [Pseudoxanthomonas sp. JBR18]